MKVVIEKELCDPVNGEIVGPYYHVCKIEGEEKTVVETFDSIEAAARFAEKTLDLNLLEVALKEHPESFSSIIF